MAEPAILFVRPKAISAEDKKALAAAGIVVVEIDDPQQVKFIRAGGAELGSTDLLAAAAKVIAGSASNSTREAFGKAVCELLEPKEPTP